MVNEQIDLPWPIRQKFHQLRLLLRFLAVFRGMIAFAFRLGLLFLADLLGDYFLEFPLFLRGLLLTVSVVGIFYLLWRLLLFPLITSRTDLQIARLVEQMEPAFGESLITSVELCDRRFSEKGETSESFYHHLLRQTIHQAAQLLQSFHILRLFPWKRLTIHLCLILLFWGGIVVYCFHTTGTVECWFSRNVRLSSENWPRLTRMILEGFDEQGIARTVKGEPFSFLIRADLSASRIPSQVHLQFRNRRDQTGRFRTVTLDQFRLETHHGTSYRAFHYTVPELIEPLALNVFAGDWKREGLVIDVVTPPQIVKYDLFCEYPVYQNRAEQSISAVGRTPIPEGTRLTVVAEMNQPLKSAKVAIDSEPFIEMLRKDTEGDQQIKEVWTLRLTDLRKSRFLRFELEETNGIRERQPQCLELEMVEDQTPLISAQLQGVGSAITPFAVLPIRGEVTDDYGLAEIYFRFRTIRRNNRLSQEKQDSRLPADSDSNHFKATDSDSKVPGSGSNLTDSGFNLAAPDSGDKDEQNEQLIACCPSNCLQFPLDRFFDVSALRLEPGDWIALSIEVNDHYDLEKTEENGDTTQGRERERAGQIGKSEIWQLEIISPTRLQGLLQAREITLRERLESLMEEIRRTKTVLEQFQLLQATGPGFSLESGLLESGVLELFFRDQARLIRDTQKEKYELQDIQAGFQRIREELEINRILTQEERGRLDRDIIIPLKNLVGKDFVELERLFFGMKEKVEQVKKQLEEKQGKGEIEQRRFLLEQALPFVRHHRQQALLLFDVILEQLRLLSNQMLNRETFQDVVEQLRDILRKQRAIQEETTESKRDQLRRLTE